MTKKKAHELLNEAEGLNPGPWTSHVKVCAEAAESIALVCGMNAEKAYAMGLLHDIGRREGFTHLKHVVDGYDYLLDQGYPEEARICLTHSFATKNLEHYHGKKDITSEEEVFLRGFLEHVVYDDYDRLIQLCDALCLPEGVVLMEKRIMDVALRYGVKASDEIKWKALFDLKLYFEEKIGRSIYSLFEGVCERTLY